MSGCVVKHRGHPYIMPNYDGDPWVWLSPRTANRWPLRYGDTILYQPVKRGRRWITEHVDWTPEHLWGCDPSQWYHGKVQKVLDNCVSLSLSLQTTNDIVGRTWCVCPVHIQRAVVGPMSIKRLNSEQGHRRNLTRSTYRLFKWNQNFYGTLYEQGIKIFSDGCGAAISKRKRVPGSGNYYASILSLHRLGWSERRVTPMTKLTDLCSLTCGNLEKEKHVVEWGQRCRHAHQCVYLVTVSCVVNVCVCMCTCTYACMYIGMCIDMYICMFKLCVCVCVNLCIYVCKYVCMHVCMWVLKASSAGRVGCWEGVEALRNCKGWLDVSRVMCRCQCG